jgi:outer membrane protein assembly factor BamC
VRIERDGQVRWLVVKGDAETMWGRVREFVLAHGLLVAKENPASGVIETEWAENRAKVGTAGQMLLGKWLGTLYSTGTRDKFRLRLERGASPGTSEIYLSHQGMEEVVTRAGVGGQAEATRWQPRASDPELEAEMLRLLMAYLGSGEEQARKIAAVPAAPAADKPAERARLTRHEKGASFLSLEESLDRAWRRVGLTLDRLGFTVQDRDRSKGVYYIRYVDPDKKSKTAKDDEYQIHLKPADAGTVVEVLNKDGQPEGTKSGDRILGLLHEQLK